MCSCAWPVCLHHLSLFQQRPEARTAVHYCPLTNFFLSSSETFLSLCVIEHTHTKRMRVCFHSIKNWGPSNIFENKYQGVGLKGLLEDKSGYCRWERIWADEIPSAVSCLPSVHFNRVLLQKTTTNKQKPLALPLHDLLHTTWPIPTTDRSRSGVVRQYGDCRPHHRVRFWLYTSLSTIVNAPARTAWIYFAARFGRIKKRSSNKQPTTQRTKLF